MQHTAEIWPDFKARIRSKVRDRFAEIVTNRREADGRTREDVANAAGLTLRRISEIEDKAATASLPEAFLLCMALRIDPAHMVAIVKDIPAFQQATETRVVKMENVA